MIPLLLADAAPDMIKTWLECLAWLVGFVAGCVGIYSMLRKPDSTPQPLLVEANKQYATQPELKELAKKMDEELGRERGARKQIHAEIAELQTSTAVLRKETEQQTRQLHTLDNKMDRVLERLPVPMTDAEKIALHTVLLQVLRSTGEIGRPADRLVTDLRMAAFDITLPALQVELRALADKSWISEMPQQLGASRFRITARGSSVLEEQGL